LIKNKKNNKNPELLGDNSSKAQIEIGKYQSHAR
jgi:hypothetical protein